MRSRTRTSRWRSPHAAASALAIGLLWAGCARPPGTSETPPPVDNVEREELVETTIRVENRHWSDVTIYLLRRSARARLGIVTSNATQTFQVPIGMGAGGAINLTLIADVIGSETEYRSDPLTVLQGQEVLLRLEVQMIHSSTSVFWP